MAQQLTRQQQQWQSFVSAAQARLPTAGSPLKPLDSNASSWGASGSHLQAHSGGFGVHTIPTALQNPDGVHQPGASPAAAMKAQLSYLQKEVQRVVNGAMQLQHASAAGQADG